MAVPRWADGETGGNAYPALRAVLLEGFILRVASVAFAARDDHLRRVQAGEIEVS